MTEPEIENNKIVIAVSGTSLDRMACMRAYNFSKIQRKAPVGFNDENMEKGSLLHKLLELYYKGIMAHGDRDKAMVEAIDPARQYAIGLDLDVEECEYAISNFQDYHHYYANDSWRPLAVEAPFSEKFYEDDRYIILVEGISDLVVEMGEEVFPVDHKGESKHNQPNKLNHQFFILAYAFQSNKVVRNAIGFQRSYPPNKRFDRQMLSYGADEVEDWSRETIEFILERYEKSLNNRYPANYSVCYRCAYKKVCEVSPDTRSWILDTQFTERKKFNIFG